MIHVVHDELEEEKKSTTEVCKNQCREIVVLVDPELKENLAYTPLVPSQ